jgi:hypothetical protein
VMGLAGGASGSQGVVGPKALRESTNP